MKEPNLRGRRVTFERDGRTLRGVVITRIRGTQWMIESSDLPDRGYGRVGRDVLDRSLFQLVDESPRTPLSPIEQLIDRACGR